MAAMFGRIGAVACRCLPIDEHQRRRGAVADRRFGDRRNQRHKAISGVQELAEIEPSIISIDQARGLITVSRPCVDGDRKQREAYRDRVARVKPAALASFNGDGPAASGESAVLIHRVVD